MAPPKKKKSSSSSLASHSDFTKAKSSLKAKQRAVPSNATNTSFKARSIVLPNQGSITQLEQRRSSKLTDDRGRGVEELVTLLRGVGQGGSKSEALDSLGTLLLRLPQTTGITTGLGLLPILLPLVTSSSAPVRSSLFRLLDRFLRQVPQDALGPYTTTITLWLTSGMNHIWKEVREDAARIAEVVIDITSHELVRGWSWNVYTSSSSTASQAREEGGTSSGERFFKTLLTALGVSFELRRNAAGGAGPSGASSGSTGTSASTTSSMNVQSDLSTSPMTKLRLLHCLEKLIRYQSGLSHSAPGAELGQDDVSSGPSTQTFPLWIFRSVFQNPTDWEGFASKWEGEVAQRDLSPTKANVSRREIAPFTTALAPVERQGGVDFADTKHSAGLVFAEGDLSKTLSNASVLTLGSSLSAEETYQHPQDTHASQWDRKTTIQPYLQLYHAIHPLLLHTFLDHAPSSLGPSAVAIHQNQEAPLGLKLIESVLALTRTLIQATVRSNDQNSAAGSMHSLKGVEKEALSRLGVLLSHAAIYFPFERALGNDETSRRAQSLKRISAGWCELVGLQQMLSGSGERSHAAQVNSNAKRRKGKEAATNDLHLETVENYLAELLHSSSQAPGNLHQISTDLASGSDRRLNESEYLSFLPTIWHLLTSSSSVSTSGMGPSSKANASTLSTSADRSDHLPLLSALLSHWSTLRSSSPLKAHGFTLLVSLCSLPNYPSLRADLKKALTRPSSPLARLLRSGLLSSGSGLGRYLYELASSLPPPPRLATATGTTTLPSFPPSQSTLSTLHQLRAALSLLLLDGIRSQSPYLVESRHVCASLLLPTLQPLFWIDHPTRGPTAGPWRRVRALVSTGVPMAREVDKATRALLSYVLEDEEGEAEGRRGARTQKHAEETTVRALLSAARKAGLDIGFGGAQDGDVVGVGI